jgi:hypothetical protein
MRPSVITVLLLASSMAFGGAQGKTPEGKYDVRRCAPKVISRRGDKSPEFHFRTVDNYKHSPVVAHEILESGENCSCHPEAQFWVAEVDRYALRWVQGLRFNKRPGCGVVESRVDVTIDFS